MTNLLRTEWLKIRKYRAFWWMTGIVALSYPGINYIFYHFYQKQLESNDMGQLLKMLSNPFTFPEAWHTVAYLSSWFIIIPSIVVIMFITNEYSFKTHRQNIIDGWSRRQFLQSKLIDVALITLLITILYIMVSLVIGYSNLGQSNGDVWGKANYIGLFFLQTFSQLSIAFLIAFLARKAFVALGIFLFYFIILEPVIVGIARDKANDIGRFMPLEISDRLIPLPGFLMRNQDANKALLAQISTHLVYTVLLLVATWGLCFWINNKRDL